MRETKGQSVIYSMLKAFISQTNDTKRSGEGDYLKEREKLSFSRSLITILWRD